MAQTRRERIRVSTIDEIKTTAWKQVAEQGAASLSLRAIAREMGMTAPGLYRYFKDRDGLVTALLIDAFDSFSTTLEFGSRDMRGRRSCRSISLHLQSLLPVGGGKSSEIYISIWHTHPRLSTGGGGGTFCPAEFPHFAGSDR